MPSAGTRLGPYEILSTIGAGGMGEVYRARDARIGREVAIKILPPHFSENAERLRRFEQEARAAGVLNHPNILSLYDVGTAKSQNRTVANFIENAVKEHTFAPFNTEGCPLSVFERVSAWLNRMHPLIKLFLDALR